jgi:hypothetical protein
MMVKTRSSARCGEGFRARFPHVADSTANEAADTQKKGPARGLKILFALLVSIILPAALYAIYVLGQLEHIRQHNLRGLESTAQAVTGLLDNTRTIVGNLISKDPGYACMFFQRQNRARLITPKCNELAQAGDSGIDPEQLQLDVGRGTVDIVGKLKGDVPLRIEVNLGTLLQQVPFGADFDRLMIVNEQGRLLSSDITPQRSSPMLPPGVPAFGSSSPVRALDLAKLKFVGSTKDAPITFAGFGDSTLVHPVVIGGTRYTLMCQPWIITNVVVPGDMHTQAQTWRLCGLIDGQRAFQQALDVAPQFIMLLLVLFTLAVISWPVLKVLSIAPRERLRFVDIFLMLLATLALVMVLSVGVADLGTYAQLRARSYARLEDVATEIETHLRVEFGQMLDELRRYDRAVAAAASIDPTVLNSNDTRVGCLLLPPPRAGCQRTGMALSKPALFAKPTKYADFLYLFWMRPCDGRQFIKGTVLSQNTPAIDSNGREYFEAVKRDRLWLQARTASADGSERGQPADRFFVDTLASITTGEFLAALSIQSVLKPDTAGSSPQADCNADEAKRFAAAMMGRPVSVRYPILAPGIEFAVTDQFGRVLFHSDERRAVFENLLDDEGLVDRLRAALAARTDAKFHAHYQTHPQQVYVHPLHDIPWVIVTFADDEILHTLHIELLAQTAMLIGLYLLLALLGTLAYALVHGRAPPLWVWPRREEKYRVLYSGTVWTLGMQLILFVLALDMLRGEVLALACLLLPLTAALTLVVAARAAQLLNARPPDRTTVDAHRTTVTGRFRRSISLLFALAVALIAGLIVVMSRFYPVTAAQVDLGMETAILGLLLVVVIAAAGIAERVRERRRSRERANDFPWVRWWRDPLRPHIVATVITWLMLGALPAYGLYKFALANEMTVVSKVEQAYLGRAFTWRACKIQDDFRLIPTADSKAALKRRTSMQLSGDSSTGNLDIYLGALLSRGVQVSTTQPEYKPASDRAVGHSFWQYIANLAPIYNETTTHSRYFEPTAPAADPKWTWGLDVASARAQPPLEQTVLVYKHGGTSTCESSATYIASRPPILEPQFGWSGILVALGFMSVLFAWTAFTARRLYFGDIEARRTDHADEGLPLAVQWGRLDLPPALAWAKTEVAPIFDPDLRLPDEKLKDLCETSTTRRAVVDRILEKAHPFYDSEWQKCDEEEKLLLTQLTEEGFANPKQHEIVRKLMNRGLIRRDPVLRPMNDSFALFVESHARPEDIRHQETVHRGMRWTLVRSVLIGALLLILIFLSVTQHDVVEVWIAYLATAAAGTGGALKLFSLLSRGGPQKLD